MKIVVTGPRDCTVVEPIQAIVASWRLLHGVDLTIVHGKARGVDSIVHHYCQANGIDVKPHPADWQGPCDFDSGMCQPGHRRPRQDGSEFCPTAGIRRNQLMLDRHPNLDAGVAFVDKPPHLCRGTSDMVKRMDAASLPYLVISVDPVVRVVVESWGSGVVAVAEDAAALWDGARRTT